MDKVLVFVFAGVVVLSGYLIIRFIGEILKEVAGTIE